MKFKLIFLILFFSKFIFAQSKINYGFYVQPKLSTFNYKESNIFKGTNTLSYLIGGDVSVQKNRFEFKTGINFSRISINQLDHSLIFDCDINLESGTDIYNSYRKDKYQIFYVGIPLNASYYFTKKENFYFNLGGEILLKIEETNKSFLVECGNPEREISGSPKYGTKDTIAKTNFGIGYLYKKDNYSIYFEPIIEYSITRIFKESENPADLINNVNSIEFGLKVGIKI